MECRNEQRACRTFKDHPSRPFVIPGSGGFDLRQVGLRPLPHRFEQADRRRPERRQGVLHRQGERMDGARDEAIPLQRPQGVGQDLLADAVQPP